jgi:RNase P/RNase MRP subunit POP5
LAFEIISERPLEDFKAVSDAIWGNALEYLGVLGCAEAGIIMLPDKYNQERQRGMIRVNNKSVDKLRATLALIDQINNQKVIVRSVGVSGIMNKAESRYIAA